MPSALIIGGAVLVLVAGGAAVGLLFWSRRSSDTPAPQAAAQPATPAPLPEEDDITETVAPTPPDLSDEPPSMDTGAVAAARDARDAPSTEPLGLAEPLGEDEEEEFEDAPTVLMGKGGMPEDMRAMMAELMEEDSPS